MGRLNKRIRWGRLYFCNDSTSEQVFTNGNELSVGEDGFALLAPYGDSKYRIPANGGFLTVIQRITKENAVEMVNAFNSLVGRVHRWMKGAPIYLGHPDDATTGHKYPVKDEMGMFADLQVRDNGLYVKPMFNSKGAAVLERPEKLFFSGRWPVKKTGDKDGMPVYEPTSVTSIGITRNPNLPTEMLNENPNIMEKSKLIALLAKAGITLSNEATDEQIIAALDGVNTAKAAADLQLANEKAEKEAALAKAKEAEVTLANERNAQAITLINERITSGVITAAEKALWENRLKTDFVNESKALAALPAKIKTTGAPGVDGSRSRIPAETKQASEQLIQFANAKMDEVRKAKPSASHQDQWREAFALASAEHPTLVTAINNP